jgi:hypothetical protein
MRFALFASAILSLLVGCSDEPTGPRNGNGGGDDGLKAAEAKHGTSSQKAFAQAYISAANADNRDALKELTHPTCIERINEANRRFYTQFLDNCIDDSIPKQRDVTFERVPNDDALPGDKMLDYPVRPTHRFNLTYSKGQRSSSTVVRSVVERDERWYLVIPAPGEEMLKQMKRNK